MLRTDGLNQDTDLGFVRASAHRVAVIASLSDWPKTTGQVALACGLSAAHASRALHELSERRFVECMTPELRGRGRLYGLTSRGTEIAEISHRDERRPLRVPMARATQPRAWFLAVSGRFGRETALGLFRDAEMNFAAMPTPNRWIPLRSFLRLLEETEKRFGDGTYLLIRELAAAAVPEYPSVRHYITRALPLRVLIDFVPAAYLREFNHGRMDVEISGSRARFRHYDWLSCKARCEGWRGTYEGAFALKNVQAEVEKHECILRGDEYCGYVASWSEE